MASFSLDDFVDACLTAIKGPDPIAEIKEVLTKAVARPAAVEAALPPTKAELQVLFGSDVLTIMKTVWTPGMVLPPHNHLMWGAIGVYSGIEDNHFFRRGSDGLVRSGGKQLEPSDVALLGSETIHAVANPRTHHFTGAIHVYGGDFMNKPRSVWPGEPPTEEPATGTTMQRYFDAANEMPPQTTSAAE